MRRHRNSVHEVLAAVLCDQCQAEAEASGGEAVASILVSPPDVPTELAETHTICPACLELRRLGDQHDARCKLRKAGLHLASGGWATLCSEALRRDLRARAPRASGIVANILTSVIRPFAGRGTALVPVPVASGRGTGDGLLQVTQEIGKRIGLPVVRALARAKEQSTRGSVAWRREEIVATEYHLTPEAAVLSGARAVLVDDNITTGATLAGASCLLRASGIESIVAVTIDRTISPRLRQRAAGPPDRQCAHLASRNSSRDLAT